MKKNTCVLLILFCISCGSNENLKNLNNCKTLKLGMAEMDVLKIMGQPLSSRLYYSQQKKDTLKILNFKYDILASSTGIMVEINPRKDQVVHINCDEEYIKK